MIPMTRFAALVLLSISIICQIGADTDALAATTPGNPDSLTVERSLKAFSDPAALWGSGIEAVIEGAYREHFKAYVINDRIITIRMPFAQNNEREELAGAKLDIVGKGKADPSLLWEEVDEKLGSPDFQTYTDILKDGREKVIMFDLTNRAWTVSHDLFDIAGMKAGAYGGMPHMPYVLSNGKGIQVTDIYNYLYCVGRVGIDCSGFVWNILQTISDDKGIDLGRALRRLLGTQPGEDPSQYVGTRLFDSRSSQLIQVNDRISNLRPGDVMLFRGSDGRAAHSAIIQSIDFDTGLIRYLQSTDEAPPQERGVHDSNIRFDPEKPELSLKDPSLNWSQARYSPFPGERPSGFSNDGERYRAFPEHGGGKVVRFRALSGR